MSKLTKRSLAMILSVMLMIGLLANPVFAASETRDESAESLSSQRLDPSQITGNPDIQVDNKYSTDSTYTSGYTYNGENKTTADENETFVAIVELKTEPLGKDAGLLSASRSLTPAAAAVKTRQASLVREQKEVLTTLKSTNSKAEILYSYTGVINGFSTEIRYKDIAALKADPRVSAVYQSRTYELPEPQDSSSNDMVWASYVWSNGYKGDGMLIAILDTGIDYTHPLLSSLNVDGMLTREDMAARVSNAGTLNARLTDYYKNDKVIFGYDYADFDTNPMDDSEGHGTHVAGIAAANIDGEGVVMGVAPNAQLMAMKVFATTSLFGGTSDYIILAALDDAVKLGADVINMSLGSGAGFTVYEGAGELSYEKILARAKEGGTSVSVSAGNSTYMGSGSFMDQEYGIDLPYASNPEYGVVGTPSTDSSSLSVASIDNEQMYSGYFVANDKKYPYADPNDTPFSTTFDGKTLEYVAVPGFGASSDYEGLDVSGKIALVQRGGGLAFTEKVSNAQTKGAVGVVVYNNSAGYVNMALDSSKIPAIFIDADNGTELAAAGTGTMSFSKNFLEFSENSTGGLLSSFSSWGVTPDLKIKPEISAPGGSIYSTYPVAMGSYAQLGGTSMASPHVAGGAALVKQYLNKYNAGLSEWRKLSTAALTERVDNLLMSTASIVTDEDGNPYPVQAQGSGMMNLKGATTAEAFLYNNTDHKTKVELGDNVDAGSFMVEFALESSINYLRYYDISAVLLADEYDVLETDNGSLGFDIMRSRVLKPTVDIKVRNSSGGTPSSNGQNFSLPAMTKYTVQVTFTISEEDREELSAAYPNGYFVDGFVKVTPRQQGSAFDLSIPFLGFVGDWQQAPAFDPISIYEGVDSLSDIPFYWENIVYGTYGGWTSWYPAGVNLWSGDVAPVDFVAFSPNNDYYFDYMTVNMYLLRNLKSLRMEITDGDGNVVKAADADYLGKSYYNGNSGAVMSHFLTDYGMYWNGTNEAGVLMPDGWYTFNLYGTLDYAADEATVHAWSIDVLLDTETPEVEYEILERDGRYIVSITAKDNHYLQSIFVTEGTSLLNGTALMGYNEYTYEYDITNYVNAYGVLGAQKKLAIYVQDYAQNTYWEFMREPDPIISFNPNIIDRCFVAGLPFIMEIDVTGTNLEYLEDHALTAYIMSGSYRSEVVTISAKAGLQRLLFSEMPEGNSVWLRIERDGKMNHEIRLYSAVLPANMWNPTVSATGDGKTMVSFAAGLWSVSEATVNGVPAVTSISGSGLTIDAPYSEGAEISLKGVSFKQEKIYNTQYFPAYTFSFNLSAAGGVLAASASPLVTANAAVSATATDAQVITFKTGTDGILTYEQVARELTTVTGDFVANLDSTVKEVGEAAFEWCVYPNLVGVTASSSLIRIHNEAFFNCANLASVTFAGSKRIALGSDVFKGVSNVTLYARGDLYAQLAEEYANSDNVQVVEIKQYAISATAEPSDGGTVSGSGVYDLGATVTLTATPNRGYKFVGWYENASATAPVSGEATLSFTADGTITAPVARFELIQSAVHTVVFTADRGNVLTADGVKAQLSGIEGFFKAEFDGTVKFIGNFAFAMNKDIIDVVIGDNVAGIGGLAFMGCEFLKSAAIGDGAAEIGDLAFFYNARLESVTIGSGVKTMGKDAFAACAKLISVTFGGTGEIALGNVGMFDFVNEVTLYAGGSLYAQLFETYENVSNVIVKPLEADVTYTITVTAGEGGTVSGGGAYAEGTLVELTAVPNPGYSFDGWYEDNVKIDGAEAAYSFTADADRALEARFTADVVSAIDIQLLTTSKIFATLAANIKVKVTFVNFTPSSPVKVELKGQDGTVYGTAYAGNDGVALVKASAFPEAGTYTFVATSGDVSGSLELNVVPYDVSIWNAVASPSADRESTVISFGEIPVAKYGTFNNYVTVNGAAVKTGIYIDRNSVVIPRRYTPGDVIVVTGVKYPELFPSYSFTFTVTVSE